MCSLKTLLLGTACILVLAFAVSGCKKHNSQPPTGAWTAVGAMPHVNHYQAWGAIGGKVYIANSKFGLGDSSTSWAYDTLTHAWDSIAAFPVTGAIGMYGFALNAKLYVFASDFTRSYFYCYDPSANYWTAKSTIPDSEARPSPVTFILNGNIYVGMGFGGLMGHHDIGDLWMYDATSDSWSAKADFPSRSRDGSASFSWQNMGYIVNGGDDYHNYYSDRWQYNAISDSWSQAGSTPCSSNRAVATFTIGSKVYLMQQDEASNPIWEFDPSNGSYTSKNSLSDSVSALVFSTATAGYASRHDTLWRFYP